nr:MAG: ORF1 [Torque teno virus]
MAWWGWWRRRWPRRRWRRWRTRRRRRVPARRPRRAVRRYRRRRVRRRRGWGRYGRRRRRLYRRRYRVRRKRKKLIIKQWQPANIRRCRIRGLLPIVICGHGRSARNYALHSDDTVPQRQAFGGALSTTSFSLKVLYDQHLRFLNRWSSSNDVLDLARYLGCRFTFYRDKKTDYIVQYDISAPYKLDKDSSPSYHPGMLMQTRHKILVPSFDTRPKGRAKISIKLPPPKMFIDKWYSQEDLCSVNLVSLVVSPASFLHPFCPPQTDNPCITFQVLKEFYYPIIGYSSDPTKVKNVFDNTLYKHPYYYQQILTDSFIREIQTNPDGTQVQDSIGSGTTAVSGMTKYNTWVKSQFKKKNVNVHFNYCTYNPDKDKLEILRKYYFYWETVSTGKCVTVNMIAPSQNWWEYKIGLFSPIFLSPFRTSSLDFPTAYRDVSYNPLNDKGVGNMMWYQYNTKADTQFVPSSCKVVLQDKPLWCMAYGYSDFIQSTIGEYQDTELNGFVCVICPYTVPPMYNKDNPQMGYVFYDSSFGNGKWTDGTGFVPLEMQSRWRPELLFQEQVLTDLSMSGPFSYKDDLKNTTITMKYRFDFKWGGNMLYQQTIRNPCRGDGQPSDSHRDTRSVQIVDPITMGPRYAFHQWDWRRGWLSDKALKRMLQKPLDFEAYTKPAKRPRLFPPTDEQDSDRRQRDASTSEDESILTLQEESPPNQEIQVHLRKQLLEQRALRQQLKLMFQQLLKTQAGIQLNPLLFNQA